MKNTPANSQTTEAMLESLIAECHALIRDVIRPAIPDADSTEACAYIAGAAGLMDSATRLGDAVGRLRGTAPRPELRQRITVERIAIPADAATVTALPALSPPRGRGEG